MKDFVYAEWFKLKKSLGFKILLFVHAVMALSMVILYEFILDSNYTGSHILSATSTLVLYHTYITVLFAAVFFCKEFSNRTFAMSLLCGRSRRQVFLSKVLGFFLGELILFYECIALETLFFSACNGFGMPWNLNTMKQVVSLLLWGFIGCLPLGAVILLIAVVVKKSIITIGAGIGLTYVLLYLETKFRETPLPFIKYIYTYQIRQIHFERESFSPGLFLAVTIITFITAIAASAFVFEKTELK